MSILPGCLWADNAICSAKNARDRYSQSHGGFRPSLDVIALARFHHPGPCCQRDCSTCGLLFCERMASGICLSNRFDHAAFSRRNIDPCRRAHHSQHSDVQSSNRGPGSDTPARMNSVVLSLNALAPTQTNRKNLTASRHLLQSHHPYLSAI